MQLPKFSTIDILDTDPGRARDALFMYDGKLMSICGAIIMGDDYALSDINSMREGYIQSIIAFNMSDGGVRVELPYDALDALCNYIPPAHLFRPFTRTDGMTCIIRKTRSYSPFIQPSSLRLCFPRADYYGRLAWSSIPASREGLAARITNNIPPCDWKTACQNLAARRASITHPETGTTFVSGDETSSVLVFDSPNCRRQLDTLYATTVNGQRCIKRGDHTSRPESECYSKLLDPSVLVPETREE